MRLWHLIYAVAAVSVMMRLARDPVSRVFLIVFVTGTGAVVLAMAALMALFQTVGALGEAEGFDAHAEAIAVTSAVLVVAAAAVTAWLFAGAWIVSVTT